MGQDGQGPLDGRLSAELVREEQKALSHATHGGAKAKEDEDEQSALKEWVGLLVRAGGWALLIYLLIFQVSIVEQESMTPTVLDGDKLVIDKLNYRVSPVSRYDVIVFEAVDPNKEPRRPRDYIKRVIGLPGETVEIHGGAVWVNGKKLEEKFGPTYGSEREDPRERQTFVVPPHHYFVMGDNRLCSKDSRVQRRQSLGYVSARQIRGLVRLRFWPLKSWKWFGRGE
jgi:signal peptidase I